MAPNAALDRMAQMIFGTAGETAPQVDNNRVRREVEQGSRPKRAIEELRPKRAIKGSETDRVRRDAGTEEQIETPKDDVNGTESSDKIHIIHFKDDGHDHSNDTISADGKVKKRCWGKKK